MILDDKLKLSDDQALTASGASTNSIDLDVARDLGRGEPMAVVVVITTAANTADADETYEFKIQTDDNSGFSSATDLTKYQPTAADLVAGYTFVIPFTFTNERYLQLYATLGGTTPSVSFDAYVTPHNFVDSGSGKKYYGGGYTIS